MTLNLDNKNFLVKNPNSPFFKKLYDLYDKSARLGNGIKKKKLRVKK